MKAMELTVGDVVQIAGDSEGFFAGCFMMVTEPKTFGAQGFIAIPEERGTMPSEAYYRAKWDEMEYVGKATWLPASKVTQ